MSKKRTSQEGTAQQKRKIGTTSKNVASKIRNLVEALDKNKF